MVFYWFSVKFIDFHWFLFVFHSNSLIFINLYWFSLKFIDFHRFYWFFIEMYWIPLNRIEIIETDSNWNLLKFIEIYCNPLRAIETHWNPLKTNWNQNKTRRGSKIYWNILESIGTHWDILNSIGIYCVEPRGKHWTPVKSTDFQIYLLKYIEAHWDL